MSSNKAVTPCIQSSVIYRSNTLRYPLKFLLLLWSLSAFATPPPPGVAPFSPPAGGFSIDGDVLANSPAGGFGDWVRLTNGPAGTGGGVLDKTGAPLNPATTFHIVDAYSSTADLTFSGGLKWTDDPNIWTWTTGKASGKTDINNVLLHIANDTNAHVWVAIAADRASTSGDSYIDFEFLQNTLTRSNNGTFVSAGPNGGRTTNDILLSLAFTGGGKVVDFFVWRWESDGSGGFAYVDNTSMLVSNRVFAALNSNNVAAPYGAFGTTNYSAYAFAEAAVDLTSLFGSFDQCVSFGFKTIMVKTKSSQSSSSTINDFVDPFQYTLKIGPGAEPGTNQTRCTEGDVTTFPLNGSATSGLQPIVSTNWSLVSGVALIDSPTSLITTAHVASTTATLRLTVVQADGCTETNDIVLNIAPLPVCSITGQAQVCPRGNTQFRAPAGMNFYSWSILGDGVISGPTNAQTVTVASGSVCADSFTLSLTVVSNSCVSSCTTDVLVNDTNAPVLTCPADRILDCPADTRTNATGVATAVDDCTYVTVGYSDAVTNLCGGTRVIARTWIATDTCGNSASCIQTITLRDITPPVITCPANRTLECPADTSTNAIGVATATDTCSALTIGYSDSVSNTCGNASVIRRTWTAIDDCGNTASCLQTITVRDTTRPSLIIPTNVVLECPADTSTNNTGVAIATDTCGTPTVSYVDAVTNNCSGTRVITRTWTAIDGCGNSTNRVQMITLRDTTKPVLSCPPDVTLDCPADTSTNNTGVAIAQDACSQVTLRYSDAVTNRCSGTKVIARTWTATDGCSNTVSCVQTITVRDITPPTIICPLDRVLDCPAVTTTNVTGVATAQDGCSQVTIRYSDAVTNGCAGTKVIARTWTAIDGCSNVAACVQTITVRDITPPVITCPTNRTLDCPAVTTTNLMGVATATDGCGQVTIAYSDSITNGCGGTKVIARTWTATDTCGNVASCVQTITLRDITPPVITCPTNRTLECPASTATNFTGIATATDTCSAVTVTYSDSVSNGCGGTSVTLRTWTATDDCGNTASCLQTITVRDTTRPSLIIPTNVVLECPADTSTNNTGAAIATDTCGTPTISYLDAVTNNCSATRVIARTWTAVDECGNSTNRVQTITVRDTIKPVLSCPPDVTLDCPADTSTNNTGVAIAQDSCSQVTVRYADAVSNGCSGTKVISRTWTAIDGCSNTVSCVQTITVRDITPPTITCPPDQVLDCPAVTTTNVTGVATAQDGCSQVSIRYSDSVTNGCAGTKVIARTWTATDLCGNAASCVQTITVRDITSPVITCPTNRTLDCPANTATNATGVATATDGCGQASISYTDAVTNNCGGTKIITRTWRAVDTCGNSAICVQTITVRDITPPIITCPTNRTLECPANTSTNATGVATATDGCGQVSIAWSDSVSNNCGGTKVIARTWTATDDCGNTASCVQTITVRDTTPPSIVCPTNVTLECPANTSTNATGVATATDGCGQVTIAWADSVTNNCGGTKVIKRTWTAIDQCGNNSSCTQTITVRDTTPPTITCPQDQTLECPAVTTTNATGVATATDGCGAVSISYADAVTNGCSGTKVIARTWTATDACGNTARCTQTITVRDTIKPALTLPSNVTLECPNTNTGTNSTGVATATDGCSTVTISFSDSITTNCGATRVIARAWTASDACGNSTSGLQTITVRDTTPPTITCPSNLVLECPAVTTTNATGVATASDACSSVTISYSDSVNNNCAGARVITRTWRAVDQCGNSSSCVQTITVRDTQPPTITPPPSVTVECGASTTPGGTGSATAQDACGSVTVTYSDSVSNICGGSRVISRTWTATDQCGNSASGSQSITVRDTTPPAFTLPANRVLQCPGDTRTNVTGMPIAIDVCGSVTLSYSDVVSNGCALTKTVWRSWTAVDQCGNSTNGLQTIIVQDTTKPSISSPNISVQCDKDVPAAYTNLAAFLAAGGTATDACSAALSFAQISDSGLIGKCPGTVTRVYRVTDACGNYADSTQTISVRDTIAPVLTCPTNIIVECGLSLDPTNSGMATATDNCSTNVTITYSDVPVGSSYSINFYAADPAANSGPYSPTYIKLSPSSLPCAITNGRAQDPLRNAVAYATNGQLDALTSISGETLYLGQIVPYEAVINMSGAPGPERGTVEFTIDWATYTTSNDRFGFDTNYMVYCAFVDSADPGSLDPNQNARVERVTSRIINQGSVDEQIEGTFRVSGLDAGDQVVVEMWLVLDSTVPDHAGGGIAAQLVSAQKFLPAPEPISIGSKTISINANKVEPLPPPQVQPPLGPLPPQPPVLPGATVSVINRTWAATDECGNRSTCVQQITVRDTTPPTVIAPPDMALECPATDTSTNVTGVAAVQEACGSVNTYYTDSVSNICGGKIISRTWAAIDLAGNTNSAVQTITVRDSTPPTLTCASNRTVQVGTSWSFDAPSASDTCSSANVSVAGTVTNVIGTATAVTRTWLALDGCGNSNTCTQTITVSLGTAPIIMTQPTGGTGGIGGSLTLSVSATGTGPLRYQWQCNGTNMIGSTNNSLTLSPLQYANAGLYCAVVTNVAGSAVSRTVIVNVAPMLAMQMSNSLFRIAWTGPFILQSSTNVTGPYFDVPGATSPWFTNPKTNRQAFFRLRSQPFALTSSSALPGQFQVNCPGVAGCNFIIQASTNLKTWVNLQTNPSPFQFTDPNASLYPSRFYRAVLAQ